MAERSARPKSGSPSGRAAPPSPRRDREARAAPGPETLHLLQAERLSRRLRCGRRGARQDGYPLSPPGRAVPARTPRGSADRPAAARRRTIPRVPPRRDRPGLGPLPPPAANVRAPPRAGPATWAAPAMPRGGKRCASWSPLDGPAPPLTSGPLTSGPLTLPSPQRGEGVPDFLWERVRVGKNTGAKEPNLRAQAGEACGL